MRLALNPFVTTAGDGPSLRRRVVSLALAITANLLILIALLTLNAPVRERPEFKGGPILIDLSPDAEEAAPERTKEAVAKPKPRERETAAPPTPVPPPPLPVPEPPPIEDDRPLPFIVLTKEQFAASDVSKRGRPAAPASNAGDRQASVAAGDSERVGTAPNGEPLYRAEWHRRPTRAELSAYLPERMPAEGWGLVACRTVEKYRVEDCVELGNSPPGSRLAGAVRQAAWQFLVRPPRIGGKPLVGTWVRIRIDYSSTAEE